jgi:hypothetical protein
MALRELEIYRLEFETRSDRKQGNVMKNFRDSNDVVIEFRVSDNKFLDLVNREDKVRMTRLS